MRYILNNEGYIEAISFGNILECNNKTCTEYTGAVPSGYTSLEEWSENAIIQAYKIVDNNLTYDSDRAATLETIWNWQVTPDYKKYVEYVLYNNSTGSSSTITLSDSAANYKYIEIFYKNDDTQYGSIKVYEPDGKTTYGTIIRKNSSDVNIMINSSFFIISDTTINLSRNSQANLYFGSSVTSSKSDTNKLYIVRVVGYKEI